MTGELSRSPQLELSRIATDRSRDIIMYSYAVMTAVMTPTVPIDTAYKNCVERGKNESDVL